MRHAHVIVCTPLTAKYSSLSRLRSQPQSGTPAPAFGGRGPRVTPEGDACEPVSGYLFPVPYPPRRTHAPLPEFAGTASPRPEPALQAQVVAFIVQQYAAGRSLSELAELTDRSHSAVRNILSKQGQLRRGVGAGRVSEEPPAVRP